MHRKAPVFNNSRPLTPVFSRQIPYSFVFFVLVVFNNRKDYKLVFNASDVGELYDVKNDPAEMHNLFYKSEYQAIKKEMLEEMHAEMVRLKDPLENWVYRIINEI